MKFLPSILGLCALAVAFALDRRVAQWVLDSGIPATLKSTHLDFILKLPGWIWFTIVLALLVSITHHSSWRAGALLMLAGVISGINVVVKWLVGRYRPMKVPGHLDEIRPFDLHPLAGGKNLCFPSGHATLAFATAAMLGMLMPRWRWAFYLGALTVAAERVLEGAHYLSDAVAAALLGILSARLAWWLWQRYFHANERDAVPLARDPVLQRAGEHPDAAEPSGNDAVTDRPAV